MPKKLIKRFTPSAEKIKNTKGLGWMSKWLQDPSIWHLHRNSVSKAFIIGMFWMSIPIPSQMVVAGLFAIAFRANIALSIALVWISNPLTMGPIFYFNYLVGTVILGHDAQEIPHFEMTWQWMTSTLGDLWLPLYLGSVVVGMVLGILGYFAIQIAWRINVIGRWKKRQQARQQNSQNTP